MFVDKIFKHLNPKQLTIRQIMSLQYKTSLPLDLQTFEKIHSKQNLSLRSTEYV